MEKNAGRERGSVSPVNRMPFEECHEPFFKMGTVEVLNRYLSLFPIVSTKYPTPNVMLFMKK